MTAHSTARKGQRIRVVLKDGTTFIDKFVEHASKFVIFENHRVDRGSVKVFTIWKH